MDKRAVEEMKKKKERIVLTTEKTNNKKDKHEVRKIDGFVKARMKCK